jgi:predicted Fe-Mo cluster-binding NifX family protein
MRLALAVWKDRISPVFDVSKRIVVLDFDGDTTVSRQQVDLPDEKRPALDELNIDVLICGAISRPLATMIAGLGVRVVPFVAGDVDEVVKRFLAGELPHPELAMPGYHQAPKRSHASTRRVPGHQRNRKR